MEKNSRNSLIQVDDLRIIGKLLGKNWFLFIIIPTIFGILAFFYTHRLIDIYEARTQIILRSQEYDIQKSFSNIYSSYEETSNQIRVIRSSNLIEEVIDRLNLNVSYYIVGRLKTEETLNDMLFTVHSENYGQNAFNREFFVDILNTEEFLLKYDIHGKQIEKQYRFGELILEDGLNFLLQKSQFLNEDIVSEREKLAKYKFIVQSDNYLIQKFKSVLNVENEEWTSVLNISVQDVKEERAIRFLDTLAQVYIEYSLQNKFDVNENTFNYINKQLEEVINIINDIESEIELYKEAKSILDIEKESDDYFNKFVSLEGEKKNTQMKLESLFDLKKYLLGEKLSNTLPPNYYLINEDPIITKSIGELYQLQLRRSNILLEGTSKTLNIEFLDSNVSQIRTQLLKYIVNKEEFLNKKIEDFDEDLEIYYKKLKVFPKNQRQLLNIQRRLEVNEKLYLFLLEKRAENVISKAGIVPETRVIEKAASYGVIWPNRKNVFLTYIGIGFVIALVIAIVRLIFFERIENLKELSEASALPVLGGIPLIERKKSEYLSVFHDFKGAVSEAFRNIRANLQYLSANKQSKIIMITSVHPAEGKTYCSVNLSTILSMANKKVVIVDFDLHKPRLHKAFGRDKDIGLSNYLIGNKTLEEVIWNTEVENMDAILSGPIPPNPSELILSEKVMDLIKTLSKMYDYVILDTPPLALISDGAILLNKVVDVGIFVTHTKYVNNNALKFLREIAEKNPDKSIGIILNGIKNKKWRYYYGTYDYKYRYLYGYTYGYSYGYGENEQEE